MEDLQNYLNVISIEISKSMVKPKRKKIAKIRQQVTTQKRSRSLLKQLIKRDVEQAIKEGRLPSGTYRVCNEKYGDGIDIKTPYALYSEVIQVFDEIVAQYENYGISYEYLYITIKPEYKKQAEYVKAQPWFEKNNLEFGMSEI
jgi:hypothetical protein